MYMKINLGCSNTQKGGLWVTTDDKDYETFNKEWGPRVKVPRPHWTNNLYEEKKKEAIYTLCLILDTDEQ